MIGRRIPAAGLIRIVASRTVHIVATSIGQDAASVRRAIRRPGQLYGQRDARFRGARPFSSRRTRRAATAAFSCRRGGSRGSARAPRVASSRGGRSSITSRRGRGGLVRAKQALIIHATAGRNAERHEEASEQFVVFFRHFCIFTLCDCYLALYLARAVEPACQTTFLYYRAGRRVWQDSRIRFL